jgi:hypothetical protein
MRDESMIERKTSRFLVAALKLSFKGEANVSWERRRTVKDSEGHNHTHVDHYRANEQYFNQVYYLLGNTGNTCIHRLR